MAAVTQQDSVYSGPKGASIPVQGVADLIAKLESADAGSLALDCEIAVLFGLVPDNYERAIVHGETQNYWWHKEDQKAPYRFPEPATVSLDAALAFCGQIVVLRGPLNINICLAGSAQVVIDGIGPCDPTVAQVVAPTPALAVCIAALKAIQHGNEGASLSKPK